MLFSTKTAWGFFFGLMVASPLAYPHLAAKLHRWQAQR